MDHPRAAVHYPRSTGEFQAWFSTDADCLDYLEWLRWPEGFVGPSCSHAVGWRLGDGRFWCAGCDGRTSVKAGTILDRTRTPLTVWFTACWLFATQKDGVAAMSLKRALEIGSYQTAWAMLQPVWLTPAQSPRSAAARLYSPRTPPSQSRRSTRPVGSGITSAGSPVGAARSPGAAGVIVLIDVLSQHLLQVPAAPSGYLGAFVIGANDHLERTTSRRAGSGSITTRYEL